MNNASRKRTLKRSNIIMISMFSQFFGCAQTARATGPDFAKPMEKVIHIGHQTSIFYAMPGNRSKEVNFDKIYQRDTAKSYQIDPKRLAKSERLTWRELEFIDIGKWDYAGKKSQGPNGQLGSLRVEIGYSLLPAGSNLEQHIKQAYEHYLNGDKGLNKKYHTDETGAAVSAEDYAERAIIALKEFSRVALGGAQFLSWRTDREFDGYKNTPFIYYVLPVDTSGYLTFLFSSTISVFGADMVTGQQNRIDADIEEFLNTISVKPIK